WKMQHGRERRILGISVFLSFALNRLEGLEECTLSNSGGSDVLDAGQEFIIRTSKPAFPTDE
ncbi:MAG: hypothetical protein WCH75_19870, partial [Candidatus Binatia bacterium]